MMRLGIDLGVESAACLIDETGQIEQLIAYQLRELPALADFQALVREGQIVVIIEYPLIIGNGDLARVLTNATTTAAAIFPGSRKITPGVWKPACAGLGIKPPRQMYGRLTTAHERDAYCIAMYALKMRWKPLQQGQGAYTGETVALTQKVYTGKTERLDQ